MKKFIRVVTIVLSVIMLITCFGACDWSSDDVNGIVDNAFENYEKMNSAETGAYSKFKDINVASSYLGYGYDVINDPYMASRHINTSYPILDFNKIDNLSLLMEKVNNGDYEEFNQKSMEEFYQKYATSINVYGKVGKCFSGGLKLDFSGSQSKKTYFHFYKLNYYYDAFYISITNTVEQLQDYLSESFKNDLQTMPVEELFNRYGTHLIKEASMGGRIEKNITYTSNSTLSEAEIEAAVNAHIKAIGTSINAEVSTSVSQGLEQAGVTCTTKVSQLGGKAINLSGEVNYEKWAESFDNSLEYASLCGVKNENSLVGIWELLPSDYEARANEIKDWFIELSNGKYDELCDMFKLNDINIGGAEEDTSWEKFSENMTKYNCAHNTFWDKTTQGVEVWDRLHKDWELGNLNFYGVEKNENRFTIKGNDALSIKYQLLQNTSKLPTNNVVTAQILTNLAWNQVVGTNISTSVGKGAYWIRVTYSDDTQFEKNKTDFLNGKNQGDFIELLSSDEIKEDKTIEKIEIVVVYCVSAGFKTSGLWRCEYTCNFN